MSVQTDIQHQIEQVGADLADAFRALLAETAGPSARAVDVGERLGLDKTLAWRITRTVEEGDPFKALHETAAPKGLEMVVAAAERAGASPPVCERARETIAAFGDLIGAFPDGRTGLEAAISVHLPEAKARADKDARRNLFRSMAHLLGVRMTAVYTCGIFFPSKDDDRAVDFCGTVGRVGLRRLRAGPPIRIVALAADDPLLTIDGASVSDPWARLLSEFNEPARPPLELETSATSEALTLPADTPRINEPVNIFASYLARASGRRYQGDGDPFESQWAAIGFPCEVIVKDYYIHRDLFPDADPPTITVHFGQSFHSVRPGSPERSRDRVDQEVECSTVKPDSRLVRSRDVPQAEHLVPYLFEHLGQDASAFRGYRFRQTHPIAGAVMTTWFELPEG